MDALVNDQLSRLRKILAGMGITFGRFTGETVSGRMPDTIRVLDAGVQSLSEEDKRGMEEGRVIPAEELYTRDQMRKSAPNILITNYSRLEYMLLRGEDIAMFDDSALEFVVMDEMHTYAGEQGSEVAALLRRLRCLCTSPDAVQFVGTSATVSSGSDEQKKKAVSRFASRLVQVSSAEADNINRAELYEIYRSLTVFDCSDSIMMIRSIRGCEVNERDALAEIYCYLILGLLFGDNRQEASFLSGYLKIASRRFVWRDRLYTFFWEQGDYYSFSELVEEFYDYMCGIGEIVPVKARGKSKKRNSEEYQQIEWFLQEEFCSDLRAIKRGSLEKLGLLNVLYDGINIEDDSDDDFLSFVSKWAEKMGIPKSFVVSYCVLLLNYYRGHSVLTAVSQKLFFSTQGQKVRNVLNIPQYFRLYSVGLNPSGDTSSKDLLSGNGRSYAQVLGKKLFKNDGSAQKVSDDFFEELFSLFVKMELLINREQKFYLNPDKIFVEFVSGSGESRYVCSKCAESFTSDIFSGMDENGIPCPVYNCKGELELQETDRMGYDKRRNLSNRGRFELKPAKHTGQIGSEARKVVENQFKKGILRLP